MKTYYEFINEDFAKLGDIKEGDYLLCGGNLGNAAEPVKGKLVRVIKIEKAKKGEPHPTGGDCYGDETIYTLKFEEPIKVKARTRYNTLTMTGRKDSDILKITDKQIRLLEVIPADKIDKFKKGALLKYEADGAFDGILKNIKFRITSLYNDMSYFKVDESGDTITYLPSNKYKAEIEGDKDPYNSRFRQNSKIGRILKKLNPNLTDPEIESFVNAFRSNWNIMFKDVKDRLRVVTGDQITYWYKASNYAPGRGTLQHSCMRHEHTQKRVAFYAKNPDKIALCILVDENNKLLARALVWKLDKPDGVVFMDRVYSSKAEYGKMLEDYAKAKEWKMKSNGYNTNHKLSVTLKEWVPTLPYLDTLRNVVKKNNTLTN